MLGGVGQGVRVLMGGGAVSTMSAPCCQPGLIGIMQACMDVVMPYVHERKQFGKAIGEFQLIQGKIADMYHPHECQPRLCVRGGAGL